MKVTTSAFYSETVATYRDAYWRGTVGYLLDQLLAFGGYTHDMRSRCLEAFSTAVVPVMGPLPSEFTEHTRPCSSMVDDHTAVELSIVAGSSGEAPIRFYVEPLSPIDGTPAPQSTWLSCLERLRNSLRLENTDLSWSEICIRMLTTSSTDNARLSVQKLPPMAQSQFFFGTEISSNGQASIKGYFSPGLRAQLTGEHPMRLISDCMVTLGLADQWASVVSFIESRPAWHRATPLFVCIGTGPSSQNRAKVYFRTQARSLRDLMQYMTLDDNTDVVSCDDNSRTIAALPRLWALLFGSDIDETRSVQSLDPDHLMSGHVVYYDIALTCPFPRCKLSINVKHFCKNDAEIAAAIASYYRQAGHTELGDSYERVIRSMFPHRPLESRAGIHNYIGLGSKGSDPRLTIYYSPEAFAKERLDLSEVQEHPVSENQ